MPENVRILLEHGADPNVGAEPALVLAVAWDQMEMAKMLLEFGATLTAKVLKMAKAKLAFAELFGV